MQWAKIYRIRKAIPTINILSQCYRPICILQPSTQFVTKRYCSAELDTCRVHPRVGSGRGSDLILPQTFVDYFSLFVFLLVSLAKSNWPLYTNTVSLTGHFLTGSTSAVESGKVALLHLHRFSSQLTGFFIVQTTEASLGRRWAQRLLQILTMLMSPFSPKC